MQVLSPDPLWTPDQVATYFGLRKSTIYAWVEAGRLPYLKIGRLLRFDPRMLEDWAARQRGVQP